MYGYISIEISTVKTNSKGDFSLRNKTNLEGVRFAVPDRTHYYKLYITKRSKRNSNGCNIEKRMIIARKSTQRGANTTVLSKSYSAFYIIEV